LIAIKFFNDFTEPGALLKKLLCLLLVLPEVFGADYFFEVLQLFLFAFNVKDNLEGEILFLSLPQTLVSGLVP
jgi:hypothetical protein